MQHSPLHSNAVITGITGQDGAYLARLLLKKGYKVYGLIRSHTGSNLTRLEYLKILNQITLYECDLQDLSQIIKMLVALKPKEFYNLAAQSSVSLSFQQPIGTIQFNINSVLNILEGIRLVDSEIKFYQASSSEMYGRIDILPITEKSNIHPLSPYAISKVAAHFTSINYRESYNLFTCSGILFNHESYLRGNNFFVKKILKGALDILHNKIDFIEVGNLFIKRDFGISEKYVQAMWLMLQQDIPDDFVICSGKSIMLKDIVEFVFNYLDLPLTKVKVNNQFFRPTEIEDIYGCSKKAETILNWKYNVNFLNSLADLIIEEQTNYAN